MRARRLAIAACALLACGGARDAAPVARKPALASPAPHAESVPAASARSTPEEACRRAPPPLAPIDARLPDMQRFTIAGGRIPLLVIERSDAVTFDLTLVVRGGPAEIPAAPPGALAIAAASWRLGTATRTAFQIDSEMVRLKTGLTAWIDDPALFLHAEGVAESLDGVIDLVADISQRPTFPKAAVERVREQRAIARERDLEDPGELVGAALARAVFGARHPLASDGRGTPAELRARTRDEVARAFADAVAPGAVTIVYAGPSTAEVRRKLDAAFASWNAVATPRTPLPPPAGPAAGTTAQARVVVVDRPGTAQVRMRVGVAGPAATTDDSMFLALASEILAPSAGAGRLGRALHDDLGTSYRVSTAWRNYRGLTVVGFNADAAPDRVGAALQAVDGQLRTLRETAPAEEEIAGAADAAIAHRVLGNEGVEGAADRLRFIAGFDVSADARSHELAVLAAARPEDVRRAMAKYFDAGAVRWVLAGDWAKIHDQVRALGWGPIEVHDVAGGVHVE